VDIIPLKSIVTLALWIVYKSIQRVLVHDGKQRAEMKTSGRDDQIVMVAVHLQIYMIVVAR
jgi:hypothetical protein